MDGRGHVREGWEKEVTGNKACARKPHAGAALKACPDCKVNEGVPHCIVPPVSHGCGARKSVIAIGILAGAARDAGDGEAQGDAETPQQQQPPFGRCPLPRVVLR